MEAAVIKKAYLICLEGQGDRELKVVGQATWDYVCSPMPVFKDGYLDEKLPPEVLAEARELDPKGELVTEIGVTAGSWENDRAIQVQGKEFDSLRLVNKWLKERGLEIADEMHGYIY